LGTRYQFHNCSEGSQRLTSPVRHHLTRLAITTLNDFELKPRALDPSSARSFTDRLDCRNNRSSQATDRLYARAGRVPSISTVHAPHRPMPHPNFVPVIPSTSRSTQSRGISPSTSTVRFTPFTLMRKSISVPVRCKRRKKGPHRGRVASSHILLSELISEQMARTSSLTFQEVDKLAFMRLSELR
jgi:hypothetical protein